MLGQKPHGTDIALLGKRPQPAQLKVLDHALSQVSHGLSPFQERGLIVRIPCPKGIYTMRSCSDRGKKEDWRVLPCRRLSSTLLFVQFSHRKGRGEASYLLLQGPPVFSFQSLRLMVFISLRSCSISNLTSSACQYIAFVISCALALISANTRILF
jgi:hypothetical protein